EEGIYDEEVAESLEESDEITEVEEGFMKGYKEDGKLIKCANCKALLSEQGIIEHEHDGQLYRFCSSDCADKFESKHAEKD
ncbi:hypothetical protein HYT58_00575, partial [Candidatus Woesearchaeota archaeon]|nr:hypothetical protein [Candidatus Woesearchaeota archaeon]